MLKILLLAAPTVAVIVSSLLLVLVIAMLLPGVRETPVKVEFTSCNLICVDPIGTYNW